MKKAPSDSPIWQLKKRELLLPLSFLITKPIKLDLSNLHYGPHYEPHYRTQGWVIRENNITAPITNPIKSLCRNSMTVSREISKISLFHVIWVGNILKTIICYIPLVFKCHFIATTAIFRKIMKFFNFFFFFSFL